MKATKAKYPNRLYNIVLRVKGSIKNELLAQANKNNMSLSEYVLYCAWEHSRYERGIPLPGSAQYAISTPQEQIAAYLSGRALLQPCGQQSCDMTVEEVAGMSFCTTCNVRIR
jgi:hypothetical protein